MKLKIGLRGSELSKVQTQGVVKVLQARNTGLTIELCEVVTEGDKKQPLGSEVARDKRDWIGAIEETLCKGEVDIALHSAKDIPAEIAPETEIVSVLERENPSDALVLTEPSEAIESLPAVEALGALKPNARVGTVSPRRRAQLLHYRPDLCVQDLRGNVPTRLSKLGKHFDAIVLASSGLIRLGLQNRIWCFLSCEDFVPAVNQGTLAAQYMKGNEKVAEVLDSVCDPVTQQAFLEERDIIRVLGADCQSALGVFSSQGKILSKVYSRDGKEVIESRATCSQQVSKELISKGALELL